MKRKDAVSELKNRLEYDVTDGGPHPDVPALVTVQFEEGKPLSISDGAMEAAEKAAAERDEDPFDALEDFARQSIQHYEEER